MQTQLRRCDNCGWGTFDPYKTFNQLTYYRIVSQLSLCEDCTDLLDQRKDMYELKDINKLVVKKHDLS